MYNNNNSPDLFIVSGTMDRCKHYLESGIYKVFKAIDEINEQTIGFLSLCESYSLYALPEFDRAVSFYENNNFEITGGRKMKLTMD
ncbi:hypothetical protein ASD40_25125 [Paenibacillus sp. Root444D2]|nr:hypothetical protein ASD40_25125 [Paenibacillus sp. Root444D2]